MGAVQAGGLVGGVLTLGWVGRGRGLAGVNATGDTRVACTSISSTRRGSGMPWVPSAGGGRCGVSPDGCGGGMRGLAGTLVTG